MDIERFFEEQKGITIDAARMYGGRYTAIDMCKFAKQYFDSKTAKLQNRSSKSKSDIDYIPFSEIIEMIPTDIGIQIRTINGVYYTTDEISFGVLNINGFFIEVE